MHGMKRTVTKRRGVDMKINSLAKMYHDQLYRYLNTSLVKKQELKALSNHDTPDYIVHLSPEALRLHREHVAKSTNP